MQTISVRRTLAQLARQPLYWAGLAALLALGYAYAMGTSAVGVDDLAIATYQQGGGFLRQSRITEWLVQALTGLLAYQRFWPEFWAAVCLALAGTGLAAVVYTAAARTPTAGGALLLAGGGLLFPFHAEAFAYSNLCITGLGMLLAVAALAAGWPFVAGGRRTAAAPAACVLLALSVGCYESLAQVWLALLFVLLLTLAAFAPRRSVGAFWWLPAALRGVLRLVLQVILSVEATVRPIRSIQSELTAFVLAVAPLTPFLFQVSEEDTMALEVLGLFLGTLVVLANQPERLVEMMIGYEGVLKTEVVRLLNSVSKKERVCKCIQKSMRGMKTDEMKSKKMRLYKVLVENGMLFMSKMGWKIGDEYLRAFGVRY